MSTKRFESDDHFLKYYCNLSHRYLMSGTENILVEQVLNFSKMVTKHDQERKNFNKKIQYLEVLELVVLRVDKYSES